MNEKEKMAADELLDGIRKMAVRPIRLMEVCGTHTVSIFRAGLRQLLPQNVELVSGPGCPVCVTADSFMDDAIEYAHKDDVIVATFGDMLKIQGTKSSLGEAKAEGADVRIVYSSMDCLDIARENPDKKVVFLAVGFETTAPTAAATVLAAKAAGIINLYMLSAHKLVPPVMRALLDGGKARVDGFILPGHVCVVTGTNEYQFLTDEYHIPGVVAGFEPLQLMRAIYRLVRQISLGEARVENEYGDVVEPDGNPRARQILSEVYEPCEAEWRGIGKIPASGLRMREAYKDYDISYVMPVHTSLPPKKTACRCGEVLQGLVKPEECPLFGKACVPEHAVGPCMVSVEGVCAAWYKYGRNRFTFE